jgi:hypothetical protein
MNVASEADGEKARHSHTANKRGRPAPNRLAVVAADVADAVNGAGGLIFDRVTAGWRVEVYLEEQGDERPLRILGVVSHPLPIASNDLTEWPDAVLVAWKDDRSAGSDVLIEHRLSAAAQAFKAQAMAAAGLTPLTSPIETFRNRDSS